MSADEELRLEASRQVRALSSPLRRDFVDVLSKRGPCSVREAAEHLGKPAATLYYHLRQLEEAGIVRAAGERPTGKRPEVLYELVSDRFRLASDDEDGAWRSELARYVRAQTLELARALEEFVRDPGFRRDDPRPRLHFRAVHLRLGDADRGRLVELLEELTAFLVKADGRAGEGDPRLSFLAAMAPVEEPDRDGGPS